MYTLPKGSFHFDLYTSDADGVKKLKSKTQREIAKAYRCGASPEQIRILKVQLTELQEDEELRCRLKALQNQYILNQNRVIEEAYHKVLNCKDPFSLSCHNASSQNHQLKPIPEFVWKNIIELCQYNAFQTSFSKISYKKFMLFIDDIHLRSERFLKESNKAIPIVSTLKLLLQKLNDDFKIFSSFFIKLFNQQKFISCMNEEFFLDKEDFSLYFAMDYSVRKILKIIANWEVNRAMIKYAVLILLLWESYPEFGSIFLGRLYQCCPYALPYIPRQDETMISLVKDERNLSNYMNFQANIMQIKHKIGVYDMKFCWLWLQNTLKLLHEPDYTNQNFFFVFRIFLHNVSSKLKSDNPREYYRIISAINSLLSKLDDTDSSKEFLQAFISEQLKF